MTRRAGGYAWGGLVLYVAVYDLTAFALGLPTLSSAFHGASTRRIGRWGLLFSWAYLTAHLFRWLPARYDILRNLDRPLPTRARGGVGSLG